MATSLSKLPTIENSGSSTYLNDTEPLLVLFGFQLS